MTQASDFSPRTVALLGLGEAGSALASGLCMSGGWRDRASDRSVIGIDTALGQGARGAAMAERMKRLSVPAASTYTQILSAADLVISVVTGEDAVAAARMARPWLNRGTLYADFNSITGPQTRAVASELTPSGVDFVDVAVMGSFLANGHRNPLLLSGLRAHDMCAFAESIETPVRVLSAEVGDASAVKILRSILMKGIEALSVECLVAARRQGLTQQLLDNVGDVDAIGFAEFVRVLTVTHLTHAKRRMEEVEKAMENLAETGVPALMSDAIRRSHARTVQAKLPPETVADIDLDRALEILDEQVIGAASTAGSGTRRE